MVNLGYSMDKETVEQIIVDSCAPFLMGLRAVCMIAAEDEALNELHEIFAQSDIEVYPIGVQGRGRNLFLLYREYRLAGELLHSTTAVRLHEAGYDDLRLPAVLHRLSERYHAFLDGRIPFPHEIGLILGYPVEDVDGFVEHRGENYIYSGYWKVYANLPSKMQLFERYRRAENTVADLYYDCNIDVRTIVQSLCMEDTAQAV